MNSIDSEVLSAPFLKNGLNVGQYARGENLSEDLRVFLGPERIPQMAYLQNTYPKDLDKFGKSFDVSEDHRKHYAEEFSRWFKDEKYFLGQKLEHSPSSHELAIDVLNDAHVEIFRADYILDNPENMPLRSDLHNEDIEFVRSFLEGASRILKKDCVVRVFGYDPGI